MEWTEKYLWPLIKFYPAAKNKVKKLTIKMVRSECRIFLRQTNSTIKMILKKL